MRTPAISVDDSRGEPGRGPYYSTEKGALPVLSATKLDCSLNAKEGFLFGHCASRMDLALSKTTATTLASLAGT